MVTAIYRDNNYWLWFNSRIYVKCCDSRSYNFHLMLYITRIPNSPKTTIRFPFCWSNDSENKKPGILILMFLRQNRENIPFQGIVCVLLTFVSVVFFVRRNEDSTTFKRLQGTNLRQTNKLSLLSSVTISGQ